VHAASDCAASYVQGDEESTVWQAGPMGSDRYTSESRSQSANTRATLMKCPDVSPLHHRPCSGKAN
jgi:hypothetical protein